MKGFSIPDKWNDRRLQLCALIPGFMMALLTVLCMPIRRNGELPEITLLSFLTGALACAALTLLFGMILFFFYRLMNRLADKPAPLKEGWFSRITGSWLFCFVLFLACWTPVWLAFWPGTFVADSATQFFTYVDWVHNTHHTLIHTLLLGFCMTLGMDHFDGDAAMGLALYSVVQMILMAAILSIACRWLRKRNAPMWTRIVVTLLFALFPFYSLWTFSAQKDVLFAGFALLFVLNLVDLWKDDGNVKIHPLRAVAFVLIAVLMMLFRNNGVYAVILLIPLVLLWAKGARVKLGVLLLASVVAYYGGFHALAYAVDAEDGNPVEMLSIPLQQIARSVKENPDAPDEEGQELLDALYGSSIAELYAPAVADPVKWFLDDDVLQESVGDVIGLWLRMMPKNFQPYVEAFLEQNLPYLLPYADMIYRFDLGVVQMDMYPIEEYSYFPALREVYTSYDETLTLFSIPGLRLLSDMGFQVWMSIAMLGLAVYRKSRRLILPLAFLLALWLTCLLGPVAIIRYLLAFFYAVPVLLAFMLRPAKKA